ncbi:nucleotide exchange factor GrpE [Candidatus Saccharibacteria bacterium]|nr:nucleotide exchange factor GrpE [Candidatus Saccharibacteria bacterium]
MKKDKTNGAQVGANSGAGVDTSAYIAKIAELEAKLAEMTADLQRTRADFENYRKQVELQRQNAIKTAQQATVIKMLPLLDDLERAIAAYAELGPLNKSMEKTLSGLGIQRISSEVGVEFNPDLHDAVMVEGDGAKELVSETLRPGYYYEGEVLRPAMVKVQKS